MSDFLEIHPVNHPVRAEIRPPGSKSLTNRALLISALATGTSTLSGVLDSVDTRVMASGLQQLGIDVVADFQDHTITVAGQAGRLPAREAEIYCENSGTSIRFLTALCATGQGRYRLDGNQRMRERPIGPLVAALARAGVSIRCDLKNDCPPVVVDATGLNADQIDVDGSISSQYLSGLLMVAPAARRQLTICVHNDLVSRPYIDMTLEVMRSFGARFEEPVENRFVIEASGYRARAYDIEPDASAASYFFAAAAITGGEVTVHGLHRNALQGDVRFVEALEQMGCKVHWAEQSISVRGGSLRGIDLDMNDISDTAQTLACVAPFAEGPTRIRNVAHNRVKETDRIAAVVNELKRAGIRAEEHDDGMTVFPGEPQPATICTYDDHRMAMSFALLGLKAQGIRIADPGCTSKTYPNFFQDLETLCRGSQ